MDIPAEDKTRVLSARIAASRDAAEKELGSLREKLDVGQRLGNSVVARKASWLGGSASVGFLLSGLFKRKPRASVEAKKKGLFGIIIGGVLAVMGPILRSWIAREVGSRMPQLGVVSRSGPSVRPITVSERRGW